MLRWEFLARLWTTGTWQSNRLIGDVADPLLLRVFYRFCAHYFAGYLSSGRPAHTNLCTLKGVRGIVIDVGCFKLGIALVLFVLDYRTDCGNPLVPFWCLRPTGVLDLVLDFLNQGPVVWYV